MFELDSLLKAAWGVRAGVVAGLGAWGLAGGAAFAGQVVASSGHPDDARPWLIVAALTGLLGVLLLERCYPVVDKAADLERWRPPRKQHLGGLALLGLGGLASFLAAALLEVSLPQATATSVWLLGLLAVTLGGWLISRPFRFARIHNLLELASLVLVLLLAAWLRLPDLATTPSNVHGDEASIGLEARRILSGELPAVFATGWYNVPTLSFALHAVSMRVFGDDLFGLRMASLVEGLLSILLFYLLVRRLWGPRPALVGAAFLAVAAWHIHFSRTGFHYMQAPAATLFTLYFVVRGIQDRRTLDWLLAGYGIGLCIEVYYAARLVPLIVAVYLGYRVLTERGFLRTVAPGLVALSFGAVVFLAPMAVVFAENPDSVGARTAGVLITNPSNLQHELDGYHVQTLQDVILIQAQRTIEAFNLGGETSLQYGHPTPLLDFWTGGLLAMSALAILSRLDSSRGVLLAGWVWLTLVGGSILTVDALFSPRVLLALPALVLGPALMLEHAWLGVSSTAGRVGTYVFAAPVLAVLLLALQANAHDYFDVQIVERQPPNRFTRLSIFVQPIADRYRLYALGRDDWSFRNEALRFVLPNVDAVDVRDAPLDLPLASVPSNKGVAFLVENSADDYAQRMDALRRAYPLGSEQTVTERSGAAVFTSYLVENADLIAANPGAARN